MQLKYKVYRKAVDVSVTGTTVLVPTQTDGGITIPDQFIPLSITAVITARGTSGGINTGTFSYGFNNPNYNDIANGVTFTTGGLLQQGLFRTTIISGEFTGTTQDLFLNVTTPFLNGGIHTGSAIIDFFISGIVVSA